MPKEYRTFILEDGEKPLAPSVKNIESHLMVFALQLREVGGRTILEIDDAFDQTGGSSVEGLQGYLVRTFNIKCTELVGEATDRSDANDDDVLGL